MSSRRPLLGVALAATALLGACRTTETRRPVVSDMPAVRQASAARAWHALTEDDVVGEVVFYRADAMNDSVYVVRNAFQQDLGLVDALGRAYRYLPHLDEPVWVGSGTVVQGIERILGLDGRCELVEFPLPEARARRRRP